MNEAQEELQEKRVVLASKEEELAALKQRFSDQQAQSRTRRAQLEEERDTRLAALRNEVELLRARAIV